MAQPQTNRALSETLSALLAREDRSQRWLASRSGLNLATVSLIISGERECAREHLRKICGAFTSAEESYAVLVAHLHDELNAAGLDPSRVLIRQTDGVDLANLHLDPAFDAYLGVIARRLRHEEDHEKPENRIISDQVEWLSKMVARLVAHEADVYQFPEPKEMAVAEDKPRTSRSKPKRN